MQLVIDTSSEEGILAVVQQKALLFEKRLSGGPTLSQSLGTDILSLLEKFPPPFDQIVLGIGPGSFTGTRVGASLAQGLALGWKIPIYTVGSLLGFAPMEDIPFIVIADARSLGFYIQTPSECKLASEHEILALLSLAPQTFSPHPLKIQQRFKTLDLQIQKTAINPLALCHFSKKMAPNKALQILYS